MCVNRVEVSISDDFNIKFVVFRSNFSIPIFKTPIFEVSEKFRIEIRNIYKSFGNSDFLSDFFFEVIDMYVEVNY